MRRGRNKGGGSGMRRGRRKGGGSGRRRGREWDEEGMEGREEGVE